jgi:2-polyprenyl-6-methoxyphenol hydroxylase-like FAD-dependent oxidoreductase
VGGPPVLIVGAGPVGLTLALELACFEVPTVVLDAKPEPSGTGSRAIVLARHALATFVRLGCGGPMLEKAVALARARTYFRRTELFCVEFPREREGELPRFLNLQQTYTEAALLEGVARTPVIALRWAAPMIGFRQDAEGVTVALDDGREVRGSYVVGCDGAHSTLRALLGVAFPGRSHRDRFLIADVRAAMPFPRDERRFFFDPPENPGRTMLVHPQPDDEWRIDWQMPGNTDAEEERASGRLDERIRQVVGPGDYELAWLTAYRFQQRVADRWRSGRAFLAGDAAHLFSPFGARGLNSGIEDAVNLGWRLALVQAGVADERLLDGYERERRPAALENLRVTGATMRFMGAAHPSPSPGSRCDPPWEPPQRRAAAIREQRPARGAGGLRGRRRRRRAPASRRRPRPPARTRLRSRAAAGSRRARAPRRIRRPLPGRRRRSRSRRAPPGAVDRARCQTPERHGPRQTRACQSCPLKAQPRCRTLSAIAGSTVERLAHIQRE